MTDKNNVQYRFPLWIAVFFLLLTLVPFGVFFNLILLAKTAGILATILLIIAIRYWFYVAKRRNKKVDRVILNTNDTFDLLHLFPVLNFWSKSDMQILKDRIGILLANHTLVILDNNEVKLISKKEALKFACFFVFLSLDNETAIQNAERFVLVPDKNARIEDSTCYISIDTMESCLEKCKSALKSFSSVSGLMIDNPDLIQFKRTLTPAI